ncbi:NmrA-like family protein [Stagonosporopsis vannaccii]|nr:NmrA-like family protein [Stagonosporopsis vannaccii]
MATIVGIAGLTSKFAQCVVKALQAYPGVTIKGFCRNSRKLPSAAIEKYRIEVVQGEFDDEAAVERFVKGTNIIICCYFGAPDLMTRGQEILVDACAKEGVTRYVPSDFSVDFTKIPDGELFPKESQKIIKRYLEEKEVAGVHILVGGLLETFWSAYFQIYDATARKVTYWGTGDEKWDLTTYETAAAYTASLMVDHNASGVFRFRGDRKSVKEMKSVYEKVYKSTLSLSCLGSLDELYSSFQTAFKHDPNDAMSWAPGCFNYWCICGVAALGDNVDNESYPGVVPTDLEGFFRSLKHDEISTADQTLGF